MAFPEQIPSVCHTVLLEDDYTVLSSCAYNHVEVLFKCRFSRSGWGLRFCISNKLPGDALLVTITVKQIFPKPHSSQQLFYLLFIFQVSPRITHRAAGTWQI